MEVSKAFVKQESKEPEHKGTKIAMKGSAKASLRNKMAKMFSKAKPKK